MKLLDWGRGAYARAPGWARAPLRPFLALLPSGAKLGGTYRRTRALIERGRNDARFAASYREQRLRELVGACHARSEYYRPVLERAFGSAFDPAQLVVSDLAALPVLTKDDIRVAPEALLVVPRSAVDRGTTSGSSGAPFAFYLDRDRSAWEWAFKTEIWSRAGYTAGDRMAVLRGVKLADPDRKPWEFERALGELRLSPFHLVPRTMDLYLELIERHRVAFLNGYPSAIDLLARHMLRVGWKPYAGLKGVLPISEPLYAHQRETIAQALGGRPIVPFYGLSEKVAIAAEVDGAPEEYEFEPLYGVAELVDDDGRRVLEPGRRGRIVATGLQLRGMPLLRYDTGDTAELASAGDALRLRVRAIRPRRAQEFLVSAAGGLVSMTAVNIHSDAYLSVEEFQFYQDTPGEAVLKAVLAPGRAASDVETFAREIERKAGAGLRIVPRLVDALPAGARGKRPYIDQRLDLDVYRAAVRDREQETRT